MCGVWSGDLSEYAIKRDEKKIKYKKKRKKKVRNGIRGQSAPASFFNQGSNENRWELT
jgi:hypothetical protein